MRSTSGAKDVPNIERCRSTRFILLSLALGTGLTVSIFSVIEEMCLVTACRDTASFTFFGFNMGWFGIAYFSLIMILLWLRKRFYRLDPAFAAMVFSGVGAELRLLWIQKYIIGSWCPLCVTISCALFIAAILIVIEKVFGAGSLQCKEMRLPVWLLFVAGMIASGLVIALVGVREISY